MSTEDAIKVAAAKRDAWQLLNTLPEFRGLSANDMLDRLATTLSARGPPVIYTVNEFCTAHRVSRSGLYKLWREGAGPRVKRVGTKILISAEAAAEWRAAGESVVSKQGD